MIEIKNRNNKWKWMNDKWDTIQLFGSNNIKLSLALVFALGIVSISQNIDNDFGSGVLFIRR